MAPQWAGARGLGAEAPKVPPLTSLTSPAEVQQRIGFLDGATFAMLAAITWHGYKSGIQEYESGYKGHKPGYKVGKSGLACYKFWRFAPEPMANLA